MSRRALTVLLLFLAPAGVFAKDPGSEIRITSALHGDQASPAVAMDRDGRFVVAWGDYDTPGIQARRFTADGVPLGPDIHVGSPAGDYVGTVSVSLDDTGFSVAWDGSNDHSGPYARFRRFDRDGSARSREIALGSKASPSVATDRRGTSTVLFTDTQGVVNARRFDPFGQSLGKPFQVARFGAAPSVVRGAAGTSIAAWSSSRGISGSLLDASGTLTLPFQVAEDPAAPALAAGPDGRFAVAWASSEGIRLRLFRASGAARTGVLHVTDGDGNYEGPASAALDADGRILVVWSACSATVRECHVLGRRYDGSGKPAGDPFRIDDDAYAYNGVAAAGPAGRFAVVWTRYTEETGSLIYGRRLTWALPGDAPCVHRGNRFLCDLAHDGGEEELDLSFGRGGDRPLLGDLDGDGRDDPCVYRLGRLLCDAAHDGGAADSAISFGQDGDVPLLADLDGEGRDDLCVRRGADLLCDSAHNGGTAELVVHFGDEDDLFLMGDVDGDGDDDPCVARSSLLCDTEHDGGVAEVVIPIDRSNETILLGDLDDDGRDDPCLYKEGRFLCDVDHDGSTELIIPFGRPGDLPMLADPAGL